MSLSTVITCGYGPSGSIAAILGGVYFSATPSVPPADVAYATASQLIAREGVNLVQQASDLDNTGMIDYARVNQALSDASAVIDGYLASRYPLPLTIQPPALQVHCCAIALYLMTLRPTDQLTARYQATIKWLEGVATGTFQLGVTPAGTAPVSDNGAVFSRHGRRVFTERRLDDYTDMRTDRPRGGWQ